MKEEVKSGKFHCAKQIQVWIQKTFGRAYSLSGVKALLHRLGCSFHQITGFLFKAQRDKQEEFVHRYEAERPHSGQATRRYFVDACHPVWGLETVYSCWLLKGQRFRLGVGGGRQRFNILGAYCPEDHDYVDYRQAGGTLSAPEVIQLLKRLREKHPHTTNFILYLDNARYQHARMLYEWIDEQKASGVEFVLAHLPGYSPNLNLIERLWKFLRKKALRQWHDSFEALQAAVSRVLDNLPSYRAELSTLMVDHFHLVPA